MRLTPPTSICTLGPALLLGCLPLWGCSGDAPPPEEPEVEYVENTETGAEVPNKVAPDPAVSEQTGTPAPAQTKTDIGETDTGKPDTAEEK